MPTKITNFLHVSQTTGTTALTTAFGTARVHDLGAFRPTFTQAPFWVGIVESLSLQVQTIAGGCTKLIIRVTSDAAGNESIVPDTEADIGVGIGTATTGSAVFSAGIGLTNQNPTQTDAIVYVWAKTNVGTATLKESTVVWRE